MKAAVGTGDAKTVTGIVLPDGSRAASMWRGEEKLFPPDSQYLSDAFSVQLAVPAYGAGAYRYWRSFQSVFVNGFRENFSGAAATNSCFAGKFVFRFSLPVLNEDGEQRWWTWTNSTDMSGMTLSAAGVLSVPASLLASLDLQGYHVTKADLLERGVKFRIYGNRQITVNTRFSLKKKTLVLSATNVLPEPIDSISVYFLPDYAGAWVGINGVFKFDASDYVSASWSRTLLGVSATAYSAQKTYQYFYPSFSAGKILDYVFRCTDKAGLLSNGAGLRMALKTPSDGNCSLAIACSPEYERSYAVTTFF